MEVSSVHNTSEIPQITINDQDKSLTSLRDSLSHFSFNSRNSSKRSSIVSFDSKGSIVLQQSYDHHEPPKTQPTHSLVKWIDSVYEMFQDPEEHENENAEDLNDNITYEESQVRIIILASFLALILAFTSTVMCGIHVVYLHQQSIVQVYQPKSPEVEAKTPHLALLFFNGLVQVYNFKTYSDELEFQWNFTVPSIQFAPNISDRESLLNNRPDAQYFAYANQDEIHVIYGKMRKKKQTAIKNPAFHYEIDNKNSETILNNKEKVFSKSGFFRVGQYLWVFGGYREIATPIIIHFDQDKTMLWHIKKQRWLWGPKIPKYHENLLDVPYIHEGSTGVSINKTVGLILFFSEVQNDCLVALAFDFLAETWITINNCFYQLEYPVHFVGFRQANSDINLKSTSYFDKNSEL